MVGRIIINTCKNPGREGREAFGRAKHLTNPADRSGSGQLSRQPSQRCEQSIIIIQ